MFNSLQHWGDSVSERAVKAWQIHKDKVLSLLRVMRIEKDDKNITEEIIRFIRTRNDITHNGFKELDEGLALTSIILSALIYCMIMTRVGISDEIINDLMKRRLIG